MTTRRHCERSADNWNRHLPGASAARPFRSVRHCHCPNNRAFSRLTKARTCSRDTRLSGGDDLVRLRDSLNRSHADLDLQVYLGTAREFAADWRKRLRNAGTETRLAQVQIG